MSEKQVKVNCKAADLVDIEELNYFQEDLKEISEENFEKLRNVILKRGFSFPFFVWINNGTNWILDGHHRYLVLTKLRKEGYDVPPLPVAYIGAESLNEAKAKLLELNSNYSKLNQKGFEKFTLDMPEIELVDIDLPGVVVEKVEEKKEGNIDDDEVPEVDKNQYGVVKGDIWLLGEHRLMCGDSTMIDDVEKLMDGEKADMVLTDPPYNVAYTGKTKDKLTIKNDSMNNESFYSFLKDVYTSLYTITGDGCAIYVFHADTEGKNFRQAMTDSGWKLSQCCIWVKNCMVLGRQDYHRKHEPCLVGWKPTSAHKWYGDRKQTTVWEFDKPSKSESHPTMKPVNLMCYPLENSSKTGDVIVDLFLGSGSTLIACEKTRRKCYGMELDPHYCSVIIKRWEDFTGLKAERLEG